MNDKSIQRASAKEGFGIYEFGAELELSYVQGRRKE